jgi:hypothetical protein
MCVIPRLPVTEVLAIVRSQGFGVVEGFADEGSLVDLRDIFWGLRG